MKVKMTNMLNGKSAHIFLYVPGYSACYASHGDLMEWAKKTGCARLLKRVWNGEKIENFMSADAYTACGIAVYRNKQETGYLSNGKECHYYRDYVSDEDELAFWVDEYYEECV